MFLRGVIEPYRCNLRLKKATQTILFIHRMDAGGLRVSESARGVVQSLQPCVAACPNNVAASMVLAGAYRFLGNRREAIAVYQSALRYDRRPELYYNLGQTQLEDGQTGSGLRNLITAVIHDPVYLDEISDHQPEVRHALELYQARLSEIAKKQGR
jgi:tetratricopeptide (TPR) repeat protein